MKKINDSNTTRIDNINGVEVIRINSFDELGFIGAAFSTRVGGVSENEFSTMNLSFSRGDDKSKVMENFRIIADTLGISVNDMVMTYQTHTTNVCVAKEKYKGMGIIKDYEYSDIDGMVTDKENLVIVTSFADCVPIFIVDKKKRVIGASHSGWKGTVGNITKSTIKLMKEEYECDVKDCIAFIGPSICKACYEVSEDLYESFSTQYSSEEMSRMFEEKFNGKYMLDLHEANRINLISEGFDADAIYTTDVCTACNSDKIFSHRKSGGKRGGMCGFLWIKKD